MVIIDQQRLESDGAALIRALRLHLNRYDLPVILLTEPTNHTTGTPTASDGLSAATDCLAHPFSLPMLRTRVRAWLVRTLLRPDAAAELPTGRALRAQT